MVKSRGMNDYLSVLWNAIDAYVLVHQAQIAEDPQKKWLIEWRNLHCPLERRLELIDRNLDEMKQQKRLEPLMIEITRLKLNKNVDPSVLLEALIHIHNLTSGEPLTDKQSLRLQNFQTEHSTIDWVTSLWLCLKKWLTCCFLIDDNEFDAETELKLQISRLG